MLELKTKWMTNTLAKASMLNKEGILCESGNTLFIVGYGVLTSSGKNTYNYEVRDSENNVVASGNDTYLDKLTSLIKGASPKTKASKGAKDNNTKAKQASKQGQKECLYLTFDEAFDKACNMIASYKEIAKMLGKYNTKDAINLTLHLIKDAKVRETQRIKDAKKQANIEALKRTLEIAIESQNDTMIKQIKNMILIEESM